MVTYSFFFFGIACVFEMTLVHPGLVCFLYFLLCVFSLNIWNLKVCIRLREAGGSRGEAERVEQHYPVHARPGHVPWVSKRRMAG